MNCVCIPVYVGIGLMIYFAVKLGGEWLAEWIEERRLSSDKANYRGRARKVGDGSK